MTDPVAQPGPDLDRHYKFSEILPDFAAWLDRMAFDSKGIADTIPLQRHPYGPDPRQWGETGPGSGRGDLLPVFVHGGYWRALRAEDHRFVLPALGGLGGQVANLEYRLMPATRMEGLVADISAGLRLIIQMEPAARIVPVGHSAGAHLILRALAHPDIAARVAGAVCISGVFDLHPIARSFLQADLGLSAEEIAAHSIPSAPPVPVLFLAGAEETAAFREGAQQMAGSAPLARSALVSEAHHMNILHRTLTGPAPLIPDICHWLTTGQMPDIVKGPPP
ncbi:hypothetical protein E2K80_04355 [Rhodophyticola sp. CCM32]|uniref:alpha/beta hydrolase n=1 Tax=Rhodophyticola sp. CCM32 TaxID=2916397 RepID=UPI00107FA445|nr:alpha/beta fold hydrolase [Rhodophyticola sp. CCM32]QBY00067.1 hypothetical protein E2K80_04355 [Rhodophyticola sp. CCM32]